VISWRLTYKFFYRICSVELPIKSWIKKPDIVTKIQEISHTTGVFAVVVGIGYIECKQSKYAVKTETESCFWRPFWTRRVLVITAHFVSRSSNCALKCLGLVYKKLSYSRGTARCVVSIEILPIATQRCRNYLYDKSWPNRWYEVADLVGGNAW